jgi:L-seryl-tRNA(Ser) seleniumtransferase
VPIVHDLGSGLLISLEELGLGGEPTAREALRAGATVVLMSGDKLLGGPQAGIVVGGESIVGAMRRNPLARAFRVDKLTLAALEATLALYRDPRRALREIPALAMLSTPVADVRARAERLRDAVSAGGAAEHIGVRETEASIGGGAFPTARIPSVALAIGGDARVVERRLRLGSPAIIGRIADDCVILDMRTILPRDDEVLVGALRAALAGSEETS